MLIQYVNTCKALTTLPRLWQGRNILIIIIANSVVSNTVQNSQKCQRKIKLECMPPPKKYIIWPRKPIMANIYDSGNHVLCLVVFMLRPMKYKSKIKAWPGRTSSIQIDGWETLLQPFPLLSLAQFVLTLIIANFLHVFLFHQIENCLRADTECYSVSSILSGNIASLHTHMHTDILNNNYSRKDEKE